MWCSPPTWWCASPPERGAGGPPGRRRLAPPSTGCCGARPGIRIRLRARVSGARRRLPTGRLPERAARGSRVRGPPRTFAPRRGPLRHGRGAPESTPASGRGPHKGIDLPSGRVPRRGRPRIRECATQGADPPSARPRCQGIGPAPVVRGAGAWWSDRRPRPTRRPCVRGVGGGPGTCMPRTGERAASRGSSAVPAIAEWLFLRLAFGPVRRPAPDGPSPLPGGRRSLRRASSPDAASSPWSRAAPPRRRRPRRTPRRGGA